MIAVILGATATGCGDSPAEVEEIDVTSVTVTASAATVTLDETVTVTATVQPAAAPQGVTWSSDDTGIATVDATGTVTLLGRGSVTITATSTADATKSGSVTIEVLCPAPRLVTTHPNGDTTWENWVAAPECFDYVVTSSLTINDELLTIEPGTVVGFEAGLGLRVRIDAGIAAEGTAADPILLTGAEADGASWSRVADVRGHWLGLSVEGSDHPSNALLYTIVEATGGVTFTEPASLMLLDQTVIGIQNSIFRHSAGYGVSIDFQSEVTSPDGNILTDNALGPAWVYATEVEHLNGALLGGNDVDAVTVRPIALDQSAIWPRAEYRVLYHTQQALTLTGGLLTLAPGTEIRFEPDQSMLVTTNAAISADGTADEPIVFTSTDPTPGSWGGLGLVGSKSADNVLDHVVIEYGGGLSIGGTSERANLVLTHSGDSVQATITNTTLRSSAVYGMYARAGSILDGFDGNTLTGNATGPIYVDAPIVDQLTTTSTFAGNGEDEVTVRIGPGMDITEPATWQDLAVPYSLVSVVGLQTVVAAPLTLLPGVDILVGPDIGISFQGGGSLLAEGEPDNEITMDAKTTAWQGIQFLNTSGRLDYFGVTNAGSIGWGQAEAAGAATLIATGLEESVLVWVTANVSFSGPNYGIVFSLGQTIMTGCPGSVYIPPPDTSADHCVLSAAARSLQPRTSGRHRE